MKFKTDKLNRNTFLALLPCRSGAEFALSQGSLRKAWVRCKSPSWMLWLCREANVPIGFYREFNLGCLRRARRFARNKPKDKDVKLHLGRADGLSRAFRYAVYSACSHSEGVSTECQRVRAFAKFSCSSFEENEAQCDIIRKLVVNPFRT